MAAVTLKQSDVTSQTCGPSAPSGSPIFAVPRYFEVMDDLPRTETAKVMKAELRTRGYQRRDSRLWTTESAYSRLRRRA